MPGLSADRVVAKGQRLAGTMHPAGIMSAFQPHPVADEPAERVRESYASAHAVLAKVDTVSTREATVLLHPQVRASLLADDPETDWRDLLSAGDVVSVEVIWEGQDVHAALADEDRETALAVGVLPAGPAWLTPADREPVPVAPTAGEEAATGHAPVTGPAWAGSLDVHDLRRALEMSEAARAQLGHELEVERGARTDLEARAARMRSQARRTARRGGAPESDLSSPTPSNSGDTKSG